MEKNNIDKQFFNIPEDLLTELRNIFNRYSKYSESLGYKRLKTILMNKSLGYGNMKRIKNYFDTYNGDVNDIEYLLNGGNRMKEWVNLELNGERGKIEREKKIRKDNGELNQYRKAHSKNKKTINRDYLLNKMVSENEINRIKFLIKKIN